MSWERIVHAVQELARVPEPGRGPWDEVMESMRASRLFRGVDVRLAGGAGIVVLELDASVDSESCAEAVGRLGPAVGIDVVSPPIRDPDRPERAPAWSRKHSLCYLFGTRKVWFGLETVGGVQRLQSIAIHYDPKEGIHPLPAPGAEEAEHFIVSTGWCGGHGEAILDQSGHLRRIDGLPLFMDDDGWRRIRERIDLSGTWREAPVVHVTGKIRLERRKARNSSIPGAPRERYLALVLDSIIEVRVAGERVDEGGPGEGA